MKSQGLYRSRRNRVLMGVCGGLAEYLDMNPLGVRIAYILVSIFSAAFPGILVYFVLALMLKESPNDSEY